MLRPFIYGPHHHIGLNVAVVATSMLEEEVYDKCWLIAIIAFWWYLIYSSSQLRITTTSFVDVCCTHVGACFDNNKRKED
jgi:hypothetical protein